MRALFGHVLPDDLVVRASKSSFDDIFWTEHARALAQSWDGRHVDPAYVDADALRLEWRRERPDPRSYLLAQSVWLARDRELSSGRREGTGRHRRGPTTPAVA